jgi:hypothetical protein
MAFWSPVDNGAGVAAFRQKRLEIERKKSVIITEIKRQAGRASALKRQETGSTDVGFLFQLNANYQNQISEPESNSESCPPVAAREPLRDGSAGSRASGTVAHEPAADDGTAQAWKRAGFTSRDDWLARLRAKRAAKA